LDWDGAAIKLYQCDNTSATKNRPIGIAQSGAIAGASCNVITAGEVIISSAIVGNTEGEYVYMTTAGAVSLTAPVTGTVMAVGVVSLADAGAGSCKIVYQPLLPTTL
jgi:hypothetical protein